LDYHEGKSNNAGARNIIQELKLTMDGEARACTAHRRLQKKYSNAQPALNFVTPFQFLIAVVLSARTTDEQVNRVTPSLFKRYSTAMKLAKAKTTDIERIIRSIGFYHTKARAIIRASNVLIEQFGGDVPRSIDELVSLPGVGRKTANVVLGQAFGIDSGIAVDTHVGRIARRLGLTPSKEADKVADDMESLLPKKAWHMVNLVWVLHGRETCSARKPACSRCILADICPKVGIDVQIM
jgi:endonuclease-3